ncbi:MAG: hypothetical protein JF609_03810 [Verrucomicrobia bacterium]|nr:hypothetical protein [Verrucomicrobiota bacterium]
MSEEPKSFWKKPWHGPMAWLLAWAGLMVATAVIFWLVLSILGNTRPYESDPLFVATEVVITGLFLLVALVRWLCCWRNVKRLLFGLACGATLLALFFAEENWRGRRAGVGGQGRKI